MGAAISSPPFPTELLDQYKKWVRPNGDTIPIVEMSRKDLIWLIDYLLANAGQIRRTWSINERKTFDPLVRPRRWMLEVPLMQALLTRLYVLNSQPKSPEEVFTSES